MDNPDFRSPAPAGGRELLSLLETAVLADVSADRLRKDIEKGVIVREKKANRHFFRWRDVFSFCAVYHSNALSPDLRKLALIKLDFSLARAERNNWNCVVLSEMSSERSNWSLWETRLAIDTFLYIDLEPVVGVLRPRVSLYAKGLLRTDENPDVLGGAAVFKGTRLSVRHVGKMLESGESPASVMEDYPYLTADDLKFAELYTKAHPAIGRPRTSADSVDDAQPITG